MKMRSTFVVLGTLFTFSTMLNGENLVDPGDSKIHIGAIRWDAWVGDVEGYDVGFQVEKSLGPKRWHQRLPFFAEVISDSIVQVRANRQRVMNQEIRFAKAAGLDYWAFVMYHEDNPQTLGGLNLYLNSPLNHEIRFAMILQSYTLRNVDIERLIGYFNRPNYQTVLNGRPLVFVIGPSSLNDPIWAHAYEAFTQLRSGATQADIGNPYIVHLWGWDGAPVIAEALELDALSAYSLNFDDQEAPFSILANKTEQKWDEWRQTGHEVVPLVTTGWDRRPRVQNPVSWEAPEHKPDAMQYYYQQPTPQELETHLQAALDWGWRHPCAARAQTILIYAWNEFDEGGWLAPSFWPDQGTERIEAIQHVLKKPFPPKIQPCEE